MKSYPQPRPAFAFNNVDILSDELVQARTVQAEGQSDRHLTHYDNSMLAVGLFGGGVVLRTNVVAPVLREALADALSELPWFSGRLEYLQDGCVDVCCNNTGGRLVIGSTSSTLEDVAAAVGAGGAAAAGASGYLQMVDHPWGAFFPPHSIDRMIKEQHPLMCGFLLHLSGGGCVLWVCAHHGLADFETLQHVAGRWAGCYRARLEQWERHLAAIGVDPAPPNCASSASPSRPTHSHPPRQQQQQRADGAGPSNTPAGRPPAARLCAADVDAHLDPAPPPPGLPPRDEWGVAGPLSGLAVVGKALYHMQLLGGGVEARSVFLPGSLLADLKRRANRELPGAGGRGGSQEARQEQGPRANAVAGVAHGGEQHHGQDADAPAAASDASGGNGVPWVSTNDAMVARVMQVFQSLPLRRPHTVSLFMSADMRRRMQPPPPAGASQLGNLSYSVRLGPLRPHEMSLGALAGQLRHNINTYLVPQFRFALARARRVVSTAGPSRVVFKFCLEPEPTENIFSPLGPLNLTNWEVDYRQWQFGHQPPLAFAPMAGLSPSVITAYPATAHQAEVLAAAAAAGPGRGGAGPAEAEAPSGGGGGVVLKVAMHRVVWTQVDATGRSFLQLLEEGGV